MRLARVQLDQPEPRGPGLLWLFAQTLARRECVDVELVGSASTSSA